MPEVTSELMYELLKRIQADIADLKRIPMRCAQLRRVGKARTSPRVPTLRVGTAHKRAFAHPTSDLTSVERALKESVREINVRLNKQQSPLIALSQDVQNIDAIQARQDARLSRIERRHDIVEVA